MKGPTSSQVPTPLAEVGARDGRAGGEDGQGDCPLTSWQVFRSLGYDVVAVEAFVLYPLIPQELS